MRLLFISADNPKTIRDGYGVYSRHLLTLMEHPDTTWEGVFGRGYLEHRSGPAMGGLRAWPRGAQALAVATGRSATRSQFRHGKVLRWALSAIRRYRPEVVLLNHIRAGWLLPALAAEASVALVYVAHNDEARGLASAAPHMGSALLRAATYREAHATAHLQDQILAAAQGLITISSIDAASLVEHGRADLPVLTIGPPRPEAHAEPPAQPADRLIFVGSVTWQPKYNNLVWLLREVIPGVLAQRPDTTVDIVGTGVQRVAPFATDPRIELHPDVEDTTPFLRAGGVFLIPERQQGGVKLKAIEAAAHGLPIVTTPEGIEGTPLSHRDSCMVAADAADFTAATLALLHDPTTALLLGRRAHQLVRDLPDRAEQLGRLSTFFAAMPLHRPSPPFSTS